MKLDMRVRKYMLWTVGVLLVGTLTLTTAFFLTETSPGGSSDVQLGTNDLANLEFTKTGDLIIDVKVSEFGPGMGNSSGSITATATLTSPEAYATKYHTYFSIEENTFGYTTEEETPELVLTIKRPDGSYVSSLPKLEATTIGGNPGFDVTTKSGTFIIEENIDIEATDSINEVVHDYIITLHFVNLTSDQRENAGKVFNGEFLMQQEKYDFPDVKLKTIYNGQTGYIPQSIMTTAVSCNKGVGVWNYKYNSLDITSLSPGMTCNLTYSDSTGTSLDDHIVSLSGSVQGTGKLINEKGYRYQGKNPNNYIWFNEELWRIIGVFDTVKADGTTERLTKIIRDESIGGLAIDADNVNDWAASDLKAILNGPYFNSTNGNNNVTSTDHCFGYSTSVPGNCDYTNKGLNSDARNMVENVKWNLGGMSSAGTPESVYTSERGTTVYNGRPTSTKGNVGLMYLSDYGYSVLSSSCARTTTMNSYNKSSCAGESWMYYGNSAWTLVPGSSYSNSFWSVYSSGLANGDIASFGYGSFPVLYLKSNTKIIEGMGSVSDPYQIKI